MALRILTLKMLTVSCFSFCLGTKDTHWCGRGCAQVEDTCFIFSGDNGTWHEASDVCHSLGRHLAKVNTIGKHIATIDYLTRVDKGSGKKQVWTDVKQSKNDAMKFYHSTDGSLANGQFWIHGEPNTDTEKCVGYSENMKMIGWNDFSCDEVLPYICEAKECPAGCPKVEPPAEPRRCQNGIVGLGSSYYYIENSHKVSWKTAQQQCQRKRGNLARCNDDKKNKDLDAYLLSLFGGECPEDCRQKTTSTMSATTTSLATTTETSIPNYDIQTTNSNVTVTSASTAVNMVDEETATTTQPPLSTTDSHAESSCSVLKVLVTMVTFMYMVTVVCISV